LGELHGVLLLRLLLQRLRGSLLPWPPPTARRRTGNQDPLLAERQGVWWPPRWGPPIGTRRRRPTRAPTAPSATLCPAASPPPPSPPTPRPQVARSGTCIRNHTPLRVKNRKKIEPRECVAWNHSLNITLALLPSTLLHQRDFNMSTPWVEQVLRRRADHERHRRSPLDAGPAASRQSRGCGRLRVLQFRADHMCQCRRPQP